MSIFSANIEGFGSPVYELSTDEQVNIEISAILNEALHVFEWHTEGLWLSEYKDGFSKLLIPYFQKHSRLIKSVLALKKRVFSMLVYRAVELIKLEANNKN